MIIKGPPTSSEEYQIIFHWLEERSNYSIGAMAFLAQTQATNAEWQLLRLYNSKNAEQLLGVAVIVAGGTCFGFHQRHHLDHYSAHQFYSFNRVGS